MGSTEGQVPTDLLNLMQAAALLPGRQADSGSCSVDTLRRWVRKGTLRSWRIVGQVVVSKGDVLALAVPVPPPAKPAPKGPTKAQQRAEEAFVRRQMERAGLIK
jgi:hypothetical protein